MYFSMHWLKQVVSPLLREVPGLGTHLSKQCSFIFCPMVRGFSYERSRKKGKASLKEGGEDM
jgi:hypothetical protein